MKLRKIMAGIVATSVAGTMAVAASAQYDAFVMYASGNWYPALIADASGHFEDPNSGAVTEWTSGTAEVTKDGTYTVSLSNIKGTGVDDKQAKKHCFLQRAKALQYSTLISLTSLQLQASAETAKALMRI